MLTLAKYLDCVGAQCEGPSYDDESVLCFVADWNRLSNDKFNRLEYLCRDKGIELRWRDSVICDELGRVHETTPQYHGWTPTYRIFDYYILARDEVESDLEGYARELINDSSQPDLWGIDFEPVGFTQQSSVYETGFHTGQNDSPDSVMSKLQEEGFDVILQTVERGQFDVHWIVWTRPVEPQGT